MGRSFPAIFLFFQLLIVSSQVTHSQTPNVFKYQAVVRDSTGVLIANRPIAIRSSIVADSTTGSIIYQETHSLVTNNFGLVTTDIGNGFVTLGDFSTIPWENGNLFLKIEIDDTGGTNFSELSTTQFQAVPYALHAANGDDNFGNHTATQNISLNNNWLSADGDSKGIYIHENGSVGIGTDAPDSSAVMDLSSTQKGFLLPRVTATQMEGIVNPAEGLQVYNTDDGCLYVYSNASWKSQCAFLESANALPQFPDSAGYPGRWRQKANFFEGRTRGAGFSIGDKGYFGAGESASTNSNSDFWEFDPQADTWTQKADFGGGPRQLVMAFAIGDKGYMGKGRSTNPSQFHNDLWEFSPATNTWTQKADIPVGSIDSYTAFAIPETGMGYLGMGYDSTTTPIDEFWEYNPQTDNWTQKADFGGGPIRLAVGFGAGGKGYVGLGFDSVGAKNDWWEYSPTTDSWLQKTDYPGNGGLSSGFAIAETGKVYVGREYAIGISALSSEFWEYRPMEDVWYQKQDFPGQAYLFMPGFSIGNKGYLVCGEGGGRRNEVWEFNSEANFIQLVSESGSASWSSFEEHWQSNSAHIANTNIGNIGIGTMEPEARLHINNGGLLLEASDLIVENGNLSVIGDISAPRGDSGGGETRGLTLGGNRTGGSNAAAQLVFENLDSQVDTLDYIAARISVHNGGDNNARGDFRFFTKDSILAERMRIMPDGKIGIGTQTPGQLLTVNGIVHSETGGFMFPDGTVQATAEIDADTANELQTLQVSEDSLSIIRGNTVILPDGSSTNELQALQLSGDSLSISDGNSVDLSGIKDNLGNHTATQNISLNNHYLSGDGGNEGIFVKNNGRVGIGTNTPGSILSIIGEENEAYIRLTPNILTDDESGLELYQSFGATTPWKIANSGFGVSGALVFGYNDAEMVITQNGRVGIGTDNPTKGHLEITGGKNGDLGTYGYLFPSGATGTANSGTESYSLYANNKIAASEFHAHSDARIKNIIGKSNSQQDLETLLQIEITDYHYRDTIDKGNTPQKKVIAQQVAEVYPQAVDKTITEVVPDIMKMAVLENGTVTLENHDLENGERVQLLFGTGNSEILEVKNATANTFEIATEKTGEVFVYGREVNDFHVVDYEAIAMLNVSATQEMFKMLKVSRNERDSKVQEVQAENEILRLQVENNQSEIRKLKSLFESMTTVITNK